MCITERRKGLVHIPLFDRGWPSGLRRGPTVFDGHGCRRSVTPSDGIMPRGLHTPPRHRRPVPIAAQLTSTTECAGRRSVWRTGD
jgi:hypothetical protein